MTVKYCYQMYNRGYYDTPIVGWYQCDKADFLQLWRKIRNDVKWCAVCIYKGSEFVSERFWDRKNRYWEFI